MQFDAEAKKVLASWGYSTATTWIPSIKNGRWLRAQPADGASAGPKLYAAGADAFATQPDGLWVFLMPDVACADAVAIEACGSRQNFYDKRFRYAPSTMATVLKIQLSWLQASIPTQGGGQQPRWEVAATFAASPTTDLALPLRSLRVLYFLDDGLYANWKQHGLPSAHEYVAPYSSINSAHSPKMRSFLQGMSVTQHFYRS